jgi:glycine amidinotransferase
MSIVNVYTEWGELKDIVVGNCYNIDEMNVDLSFKLFFAKNITSNLIKKNLSLQKRLVEQRQEDLDGLASLLKTHKIKVQRPSKLKSIKKFTTPNFSDFLCPVDNPRDQTLIVGNEIIETSCQWRRRFFENDLMKEIFMNCFNNGAKWTTSPRPSMTDDSFDFTNMPWEESQELRDYKGDPNKFEIMFDGAQCLKFGKDIVMNVSTMNHKLGAKWLQRHLGDQIKVHMVELTDHHIDGMFMPLKPGVLLLNPNSMKNLIHKLPAELQRWKHIIVPEEHSESIQKEVPQLASSNINVNVLSINEKQVLVFDHDGSKHTAMTKTLEKNGFEAIPIRLRHSRMFGGGLHCATLDIFREGSLESYFKGH